MNTLIPLTQNLVSSGPVALGSIWTLFRLAPVPGGLLFLSHANAGPFLLGTGGWWFLDQGPPLLVVPLPAGPVPLKTFIPQNPQLLGLELWLQDYHPSTGLAAPVFEVVTP